MPDVEQRYTLDEARWVIARRECVDRGHDLTMLQSGDSWDPFGAVCDRCGRRYEIKALDGQA